MTIEKLQEILGDRILLAVDENRTDLQRKIDNEQSYVVYAGSKQFINAEDIKTRNLKLNAQIENKKPIY